MAAAPNPVPLHPQVGPNPWPNPDLLPDPPLSLDPAKLSDADLPDFEFPILAPASASISHSRDPRPNPRPPIPDTLDPGPETLHPKLNWLFVDLNSYFASVEQEVRPELRGRPVAVVPMMADTTVCHRRQLRSQGIRRPHRHCSR